MDEGRETQGGQDDAEAVRLRVRDSMSQMARAAYQAAHGAPVPDAPRGVRWRLDTKVAASIAVVVAVLAALAWSATRATSPPVSVADAASLVSVSPRVLVVDVEGAVASPGVVEFAEGSRVRDAVEAAGGFADDAVRASVNLARPLRDGEQIYVPRVGESAEGPVNVNVAGASELESLPGIGPVLAERIVSDRASHGPFSGLEDLERVAGIGPSLVARLDGLATA